MAIKFNRSRKMIKEIDETLVDSFITVMGWVNMIRKQNPLSFIQLNDGSSIKNLQVVITDKFEQPDIVKDITRGASIKVFGKLIKSPAPEQPFELQAINIEILGLSTPDYPINKKAFNLEYLRSIEHLRIRTPVMKAVHKIRNRLSYSIHNYFQGIGCHYVHTPIISSNDCEGAGETFTITTQYPKDEKPRAMFRKNELFKEPVFLTVSGQLHGESYACGLGDIYTFGPTFRAENSNTTRHLCEFWMIEPELCFINQNDLHNLCEDFIRFCVNDVFDNCMDELKLLEKRDEDLIKKLTIIKNEDFIRLEYKHAITILQDKYIKEDDEEEIKFGLDLSSRMEKFLTEDIFKKPVMIFNYPKAIKSFYMKTNKDEEIGKETVQAVDVLVPGIGEIIGGSIREDNYDLLEKIVKDKDIKNLDWYLDLRKYGSVPHGGFGLGFERLVQLCTGMKNIRDVIPYPRYPKHVFA